jgi:hypothetical protein
MLAPSLKGTTKSPHCLTPSNIECDTRMGQVSGSRSKQAGALAMSVLGSVKSRVERVMHYTKLHCVEVAYGQRCP